MHNVVFDILQQIFHGRIDRALDRQLALSVFIDGRLIDRILAGQAANDLEMYVLLESPYSTPLTSCDTAQSLAGFD